MAAVSSAENGPEPLVESPAFTYDGFVESSASSPGSGDGLAEDVLGAGENAVRTVTVASAVATIATTAIVVGGIVGVTYLVVRKRA